MLVEVREVEGAEKPVLGFETLTFAPIDRRLIEPALLTAEERSWLDSYHAQVADIIGPLLDGDVAEWLKTETAPL